MAAPSRIEFLKNEYVGKTFNWLTILDVVIGKWHPECICRCKCGKEKKIVLDRVIKGVTKSCGCYRSSKECSENQKEYWKNNPDKLAKRAANYSKWCSNNPEKVRKKTDKMMKYFCDHPEELVAIGKAHSEYYKNNPEVGKLAGEKYSKWCKDNPDKVREKTDKQIEWYNNNNPDKVNETHGKIASTFKNTRIRIFSKCDLSVVHPDDIENLLSGSLTSKDKIRSKCPQCGRYDYHRVNAVINYTKCEINNLLCNECHCNITSSAAEQEIANFISTFYTGKCVRNTRDIISPLELDLYYPEKKIAIEFNGDYWHDEDHKGVSYHYNKYNECSKINIILVSIFESAWDKHKDSIKQYLTDLFNGVENELSFNGDYMNNNYPSPVKRALGKYKHDFYKHHYKKVYTCGFSKFK